MKRLITMVVMMILMGTMAMANTFTQEEIASLKNIGATVVEDEKGVVITGTGLRVRTIKMSTSELVGTTMYETAMKMIKKDDFSIKSVEDNDIILSKLDEVVFLSRRGTDLIATFLIGETDLDLAKIVVDMMDN